MTQTVPTPATESPQQSSQRDAAGGTRWQRVRTPLLVIGGLGLTTLALHLHDPHQQGSWGLCPSAALGIYCPGCGGLRAVNDLTNGDVGAAASSNLAFIVALPVMVVALALWLIGRWQGRSYWPPAAVTKPLVTASLVLLAVFTVVRNLPFGSWLAP